MVVKRNSSRPVASCELYVDKVVKYISGLLQLLLGIVDVVLAYGQFIIITVVVFVILTIIVIGHN
jgi:hypothetical protein